MVNISYNKITVNLFCIHGNLQLPSCWSIFDNIKYKFGSSINIELKLYKINLWHNIKASAEKWSNDFCTRIKTQNCNMKNILLGYSLGGRLAMEALCEYPELWTAAVIISAHPGFESKISRQKSLDFDNEWADKFRDGHWNNLINEWNKQTVFCGIQNRNKLNEFKFDRTKIGSLFTSYSKGKQRYLLNELKSISNMKILYITGEHDKQYCALGKKMSNECKNVILNVIKNAGHRVPWENSVDFSNCLISFIREQIK